MVGIAVRTVIGITVGLLFLTVVLVALIADVVATDATPSRQKPTQRARNPMQWARS